MSQTPASSNEPRRQEGISLDELTRAFAQVMGAEPQSQPDAAQPVLKSDRSEEEVRQPLDGSDEPAPQQTCRTAMEDPCPISPLSILEAMLFVGNRDNTPLTTLKAAELMRDVTAEEIPTLIDELNRRYAADCRPYSIIGDGDGYRLSLRKKYSSLRNKFYGRIHEARLSQAAIDVLAIVAYQQPLTGERVARLRGKPSNHVLSQLVRRGLLRVERPKGKRRPPNYLTTERFLMLFNLQTLNDLPRSEDSPT
jgi:segregation and condensation protein B